MTAPRMDWTGCSAGRFSIHSAMASFMTVPLLAKELWQGLWAGGDEVRAQSSSWHHEPGQISPEGWSPSFLAISRGHLGKLRV